MNRSSKVEKLKTLVLTLAFSALILLLWPVLAYIFKVDERNKDP
jgi:hypothetical protein